MTQNFKKLLDYQALDLNADRVEREVKNCEERKKANQLKQIFESANDSRKKLGIMLQKLKQDMLLLQKQTDELVSEIQQCGSRVHEGFDQLEQYAQEGKRLKKLSDKAASLTESVKKIMLSAEQTEKKLKEMTERAAKARDEFAQCKEAYEERLKQAMPAIEEARRKRDEAEKDVSPELLAKYKNLRQHRIVPTAKLEGTKCSGCNMELPSALAKQVSSGKEIVECENCARLLYVE